MMGRRSGEQWSMVTASGSSIAILQERFKQLERVREKREEKELLQFLCGHDDDKANISTPCPTNIPLFEPFITQQQHQHFITEVRDQLSLDLDCWKKFKDEENTGKMKNVSDTSPADRSVIALNKFDGNHDGSEVDTTLHL